ARTFRARRRGQTQRQRDHLAGEAGRLMTRARRAQTIARDILISARVAELSRLALAQRSARGRQGGHVALPPSPLRRRNLTNQRPQATCRQSINACARCCSVWCADDQGLRGARAETKGFADRSAPLTSTAHGDAAAGCEPGRATVAGPER